MNLDWISVATLQKMISSRKISPIDLVRQQLERIDRLNPVLRSHITVNHEDALTHARQAETALFKGERLGPLHGIPLSVKDNISTKGIRTTMGSLAFADHVPTEDAVMIERLKAAGAIILGKTNTPEFALSSRTVNRLGLECVNPWDLKRTAAGSSGGAGASVAAGIEPLAVATDGGGSIRFPAAFNGVFGVVASAGRIPRFGCATDHFRNPFSRNGLISREVRDAAIAFEVMCGWDWRDPSSSRVPAPDILSNLDRGVRDMRIGWLPALTSDRQEAGVQDLIRDAVETFSHLGAVVETVSRELPDTLTMAGVLSVASAGKIRALAHDPAVREKLSPFALGIADAAAPSAAQEQATWTERSALIEHFDALFDDFDLIATPTTCFIAPECPEDPWAMFAEYREYAATPMLVNLTGAAAAAIPCGFSNGMPISLQLIAKRLDEVTLFRACRAFEEARPWHGSRPEITA